MRVCSDVSKDTRIKVQRRLNSEYGPTRRRTNKDINKFQVHLNGEYGPTRLRTNGEINKFQGRFRKEYRPARRRMSGEIYTFQWRLKKGREQWRVKGQLRDIKRRLFVRRRASKSTKQCQQKSTYHEQGRWNIHKRTGKESVAMEKDGQVDKATDKTDA